MNLQESIDTHFNMVIDNAHIGVLPADLCPFCSYGPVRRLKVTQYCPKQSYHCPGCGRSYWVPPERIKGE